jgi:hypothetical protein
MRTTVTLDADLIARVRELANERGISFKDALNAAIRAGLAQGGGRGRPYREQTRALRVRPGVDLTKALSLADDLEDEATIRKVELRK